MADFKHQMYRHLRSARQWLTRAEEAFDKDSDIQGELNLFLAQAELQQLKEVKRSRQWRYKYFLLRHGLALFLAVTVTAAGMGGYWWFHQQKETKPVPFSAQETNLPVKPVEREKVEKPASKEAAAPNAVQTMPQPTTTVVVTKEVPAVSVSQEADNPRQTDKVSLPSDEKQKLIRAAGKSLRGQ